VLAAHQTKRNAASSGSKAKPEKIRRIVNMSAAIDIVGDGVESEPVQVDAATLAAAEARAKAADAEVAELRLAAAVARAEAAQLEVAAMRAAMKP